MKLFTTDKVWNLLQKTDLFKTQVTNFNQGINHLFSNRKVAF